MMDVLFIQKPQKKQTKYISKWKISINIILYLEITQHYKTIHMVDHTPNIPKREPTTSNLTTTQQSNCNSPEANYFYQWTEEDKKQAKLKDKKIAKLAKENAELGKQLKDLSKKIDQALSKIPSNKTHNTSETISILEEKRKMKTTASNQKIIERLQEEERKLKEKLKIDISVQRLINLEMAVADAKKQIPIKTKQIAELKRSIKQIENSISFISNKIEEQERDTMENKAHYFMLPVTKLKNKKHSLKKQIQNADRIKELNEKKIQKMNEEINCAVKLIEEKEAKNIDPNELTPQSNNSQKKKIKHKITQNDVQILKEENKKLEDEVNAINASKRKLNKCRKKELEILEKIHKKEIECRTKNHILNELQSMIYMYKIQTSPSSKQISDDEEEDDLKVIDQIRIRHKKIFKKQTQENRKIMKSMSPVPIQRKFKARRPKYLKDGISERNLLKNKTEQSSPKDISLSNIQTKKSQKSKSQLITNGIYDENDQEDFDQINSKLNKIGSEINDN